MTEAEEIERLSRSFEALIAELRRDAGERAALASRVRQLGLRIDAEHEDRVQFEQAMVRYTDQTNETLGLHGDRIAGQAANTKRWQASLAELRELVNGLTQRLFPNLGADFDAIERALGRRSDDAK